MTTPDLSAELAAHQARQSALREAHAAALPGPLREAFAAAPQRLHGLTLQPVTCGLVALLTRMDSPLLGIIRVMRAHAGEDLSPEAIQALIDREVPSAPEAMIETVFAFVTPARECRSLLDQGRLAFREAAMARVGDVLHPVQLADLERAIGQHFAASFATQVDYEPERTGAVGFQSPPAASPVTASAGGSNSSQP